MAMMHCNNMIFKWTDTGDCFNLDPHKAYLLMINKYRMTLELGRTLTGKEEKEILNKIEEFISELKTEMVIES